MELCRACSRLCLECAATRVDSGEDVLEFQKVLRSLRNVTVDDTVAVQSIFSFDENRNVVGLTVKQKIILLKALSVGKDGMGLSVGDITQREVVDFVKRQDAISDAQKVVDDVINKFSDGNFAKFEKKTPEDQNKRNFPAAKSRSSSPPIAVRSRTADGKRSAPDVGGVLPRKRKVERKPL
jgi:hypothetical protein